MEFRDDSSLSLKVRCFILCFCISIPAFTQNSRNYPVDLIVLLDTSSSMSAFYHDLRNYLTGPFLREHLRLADTFHLISFSDTARLEIVRRVMDRSDVEVIIGRLLLMYPLDPYSDIDQALLYAENYINTLAGDRQKRLVLITDGDHNPPAKTSSNINIEERISATQAALRGAGSLLTVVKVPDGMRTSPVTEPSRQSPAVTPPPTAEPESPPPSVEPPAPPPPQIVIPEPEKPKVERPPPPEPRSPPSLAVKPLAPPPQIVIPEPEKPKVERPPPPEPRSPPSLAVKPLAPPPQTVTPE
ncbi:MAG: VWA domain-containing protein, partial [Spirochaetaceae bacterium]|nr:VWA domain-containing protein [Spirochaetaceae bacterium]